MIVFTLAAILTGSRFTYADQPSTSHLDPIDLKNIMLVKDVKAGMKGYGKTVFLGTKIDTFKVEVLGVLKKANMGTDLILVKMSGGPLVSRGTNGMQGMSGSPVYINGKLIGAFAYAEAFVKEPIGMVTPIEYMLDSWDPGLPSKPSSFVPFSTTTLEKPVPLAGRLFNKITIDSGDPNEPSSADAGTLVFRPLSTPLVVSGLSPHVLSALRENLKPLNIYPVAGSGPATDKSNLNIDLQPGSAIGVSLITGDMDATGVGTVTYRRGNRVLAFGHPMIDSSMLNGVNGIGPMDAPITTAYVYGVSPSVYLSHKDAGPVKVVGRLLQDRPWAISGEIGSMPNMVPLTVHVTDGSRGRTKDFNVKVVDHPVLAPALILAAADQAIYDQRGTPSDATAKVKVEVVADEVGTITRENTFFDPINIDAACIKDLQQILTTLQYNKFHPVGIKSVRMWVEIAPKHSTAKLERVFVKEGKFKPGETVEIGAVLRPFSGVPITKTISLMLPKDMPNGQVSVQVRGGATSQGGGLLLLQPLSGSSTGPVYDNLRQVIAKFLERDKNNELIAKITLAKSVPSIAGEKFSGLPPSIAEAMKSAKTTTLSTDSDEVKAAMPTDWVVSGTLNISINVQRPDKSEKKSAAPKAVEPASPVEVTPALPDDADSESDSLPMSTMSGDLQLDAAPVVAPLPVVPPADATTAKDATPTSPTDKPASPAAKTETAEVKTIGRAPTTWTQTSQADFTSGTLTDTTATTGDLLTLSASLKPLYDSAEMYAWSVLPDGAGSVYVGTGNHGTIYKVAADGSASVFCKTQELEIHSLAKDAAGNVYAGTSPNGTVYKIDRAGNANRLFIAPEKYIVAVALDSKSNLYAATGDKCKVYKVTADGKVSTVLDSPEDHALSLAVDASDNLYVGTGLDGVIYKITSDGHVSAYFDAAEDSITAMTFDSKGTLFAGTSSKGIIYKLAPGVPPKVIYDKATKGIISMCSDAAGNVYAANASSIYKIAPDETVSTVDNDHDLQFLSIAVGGGVLYAGTGNIGSVYTANIGSTLTGTYESQIHDCGSASTWGTIGWNAEVPSGASVYVQTRTGSTPQPDATWSDWSAPYTVPGTVIHNPTDRYIEYMATLKSSDVASGPKVKDISIVYLPMNQSPKVAITSPKGAEKWSKTKTIKWTGTDPDKDTLTYKLSYSTDGGATWLPMDTKTAAPVPADKSDTSKPVEPVQNEQSAVAKMAYTESGDPQKDLAELARELALIPNLDQDSKDAIMAEAKRMVAEGITESGLSIKTSSPAMPDAAASNNTKDTTYSWDTTKIKDGAYMVKIVASDRLSNPVGALTDEAISEPFIVINKAPGIFEYSKTLVVRADKSASLEGFAYQTLASIAGVQYRVDTGDWASAAASDGIFDGKLEAFTVETEPLTPGDHTLELQAIDAAGNSASAKVPVKVQ